MQLFQRNLTTMRVLSHRDLELKANNLFQVLAWVPLLQEEKYSNFKQHIMPKHFVHTRTLTSHRTHSCCFQFW